MDEQARELSRAAVRALNDAFDAFKRWKPDASWNGFVRAVARGDDRVALQTIREQVTEFHVAFGQDIGEKPAVPDKATVRLRAKLVAEEAFEFVQALIPVGIEGLKDATLDVIAKADVRVNLAEAADALADLDYVSEGSRLAFGINGEPIAALVHANNLSKLGPDGKPLKRADGKVVKPDSWTPPDVAGELRRQGWSP